MSGISPDMKLTIADIKKNILDKVSEIYEGEDNFTKEEISLGIAWALQEFHFFTLTDYEHFKKVLTVTTNSYEKVFNDLHKVDLE